MLIETKQQENEFLAKQDKYFCEGWLAEQGGVPLAGFTPIKGLTFEQWKSFECGWSSSFANSECLSNRSFTNGI